MNGKTVSVVSVAVACAAAAAISCVRFVNRAAADRRAYEERLMAIGFDDFRGSDFRLVHPLFQKYGANATYNFPPFTTECEEKTRKRCAMLEEAGSEVGDHTWWHWNNTYDDPCSNGQDPAHPDGNQVPFPSNDQMRKDRGDGKNVFGFGLEAPTGNRIKTYDYGKSDWKLKAAATPWGQLTDEECQEIRDHFAVYGNAFGMLDRLDELSNRYLGTTGKSRGSWDAKKGCYTGGVFTGCKTSANHEIWERTLELMRAYMRDLYRKDFAFETWSWPGRYNSPFLFRKDGRTYFDEQCTKPANALSRFESSRLLGADGRPLNRSWAEALRAYGYKMTHDMTHPSRRDGLPMTMMRRQLFKNASYSRIDALAYSTDSRVDYGYLPREYPESYFTGTVSQAAQMYDGGGSFRKFVEAMRDNTAQGVVVGEVIDSEDTYSERVFLEEVLKFAKAMGIRTVAKRDAFRACFGRTCVYGNLIRNTDFRNSAKEYLKDAKTVPENPDGYAGKCRVNEGPQGRTLVTEGETSYVLFGVPTGELEYSVKAKGSGRISIRAVKNSTLATLKNAEQLAEVEVKDGAAKVRFTVPDNPVTDYEPQWEGLGNKVMALQFVYPAGLEISEVRLEKPSFANWLLGLFGFARADATAKIRTADGDVVRVSADFTTATGTVKPLHAVNNAPCRPTPGSKVWEFQSAGIPYMRTHDTVGMWGGGHYVDVPNVFPNFEADENDPANYDFAFTDGYLAAVVAAGTKVYYRLGVTIENYWRIKSYNIDPPKDFAKWARICEHIVRHYNEGWANGHHWNIEYWEIWNEPENPPMWTGTKEQYFELYRVAANHLKTCFPKIKVGGYGGCGFYAVDCAPKERNAFQDSFVTWFEDFCKFVTNPKTKAPLDFYSWHMYICEKTPYRIVNHANYVRKTLDAAGLAKTESHFNEWNYVGPGWGDFWSMRHARGAAMFVQAFCMMQTAPVDLAMYYDACPTRTFCGLFDLVAKTSDTRTTTFFAFRMWNRLYRLGTSCASAADADDFGVSAARGADGGKALILANNSDRARTVDLSLKGADGEAFEVYLLDDAHDSKKPSSVDVRRPFVLSPYMTALITTPSRAKEKVDRGTERKVFAGQDATQAQ